MKTFTLSSKNALYFSSLRRF